MAESCEKKSGECSLCGISIENIHLKFTCSDCTSQNGSSSEKSAASEFLCDVCVLSHFRRRHRVLDYKGFDAIVCEEHLIISNHFCEDCEKLICDKCLRWHFGQKHEIVPMADKATQFKKRIHEVLTICGQEYKPLALKLAAANESLERYQKTLLKFSPESIKEDILGIFKDVFNESITGHERFGAEGFDLLTAACGSLKSKIELIGEKERKLRNVLSLSDFALSK